MTFKEWTAVIQLAGVALITAWLVREGFDAEAGMAAVALRLVWAIGIAIVFNIIASIVIAIGVSIARRQEFKDERADERDAAVSARSQRNAYIVTSLAAAIGLVALAMGAEPVTAAYVLFGAPMLGGAVDAACRLIYYRIG